MKINFDKSLGLDKASIEIMKSLMRGNSLTASDISKMIDYPRTTILYKLHQLGKRGMTESMRSGKERFWNITDEYNDYMSASKHANNIANIINKLDTISASLQIIMKDKDALPKDFPEKAVAEFIEKMKTLKS